MIRKILYALLSLVLVVGCEFDNVDEFETSDQELGGDTLGDIELSPYWDWADAWPGAVGSTLERVNDADVVIQGGYEKFPYYNDVYPLQSTGYYAAPAETVQIQVPSGASTENLYCQIGMGHALYSDQYRERYSDVTLQFKLEEGLNRVMSYFGGFIYIYYNHDEETIPGADITITISNAIKSPDFILGETDERTWIDEVYPESTVDEEGNEVEGEVLPYLELRSDRIIMTCGVEEVKSEDISPTSVLTALDYMVEVLMGFGGNDMENQLPVRIHSDLQVPDSLQTTTTPDNTITYYGYKYPMTLLRDGSHEKALDVEMIKGSSLAESTWYTMFYMFAELFYEEWWDVDDYDAEMWCTPLKTLAVYYYSMNGFGTDPNSSLAAFATTVERMYTGQCPVNTLGDSLILCDLVAYPRYTEVGTGAKMFTAINRSAMFVQLMTQSDWGLLTYIHERSRELGFVNDRSVVIDNCDMLAMCASEYLNMNLCPFFDFWRFPLGSDAADYIRQFDSPEKIYSRNGLPCYFYETPLTDAMINEIGTSRVREPKTFSNIPSYEKEFYQYDFMEIYKECYVHINYYTYPEITDLKTTLTNVAEETGLWLAFDGVLATEVSNLGRASLNAADGPYPDPANNSLATDALYLTLLFDREYDINALVHAGQSTYYSATSINRIQYLTLEDNTDGGVDSVWSYTWPDEFIIKNSSSQYWPYYFMRSYKTSGIKFLYQPTDATSWRPANLREIHPAYYGSAEKIEEIKNYIQFGN